MTGDGRDAIGRMLAALAIAALIACVWRTASVGAAAGMWPAIAALVANLLLARRPVRTAPCHLLPAKSDPVTGLLARSAFVESAGGTLRDAIRRRRGVALLLVSIEQIDGDGLAAAGDVLRRALPARAIGARIDDDTLAILAGYDPRHAGTIDALADFLLGALAQPLTAHGTTIRVRAAIGIADTGSDITISALITRAKTALDAARTENRHRPVRFDAAMARAIERRAAAVIALRDGIANARFAPCYRPCVADDRLLGFAVCAHDERDGSEAALDTAEKSGLSAELAATVMRRAFVEARDWHADLQLSFALTPSQLDDPWLAHKIVKLLVETGYPARRLEIAVPERASGIGAVAHATLGSLAGQGVRLALTGLGGAGSSLAALTDAGFDRLETAPELADRPALTMALTGLGASLGLPVTPPREGEPIAVGAARRMLAERGLLPQARSIASDPPAMRRAG